MAFSIRFGNLELEGIAHFQGSSPYRVTQHRFPRRPGSIAPRVPALDAKRTVLQGELWKDSEAQIITYFETLGNRLDAGRDKLYLRDNDRFLNAVLDSLDWSYSAERVPTLMAQYTCGFVSDDPYWYDPTSHSATGSTPDNSAFSVACTNNGGAQTPPIIEIIVSAGALTGTQTITNSTTGLSFSWLGTADNTTILFDCRNSKVTIGAANGLPGFTPNFFNLVSGVNNIRWDFVQSVAQPIPTVTMNISWLERWSQA